MNNEIMMISILVIVSLMYLRNLGVTNLQTGFGFFVRMINPKNWLNSEKYFLVSVAFYEFPSFKVHGKTQESKVPVFKYQKMFEYKTSGTYPIKSEIVEFTLNKFKNYKIAEVTNIQRISQQEYLFWQAKKKTTKETKEA